MFTIENRAYVNYNYMNYMFTVEFAIYADVSVKVVSV